MSVEHIALAYFISTGLALIGALIGAAVCD